MIRSIRFPHKESVAFRDQLNNAGDDFVILILPDSTAEGDGVKFSLAVRTPSNATGFTRDGVDCDDEPVNSSHVCPGPLCP